MERVAVAVDVLLDICLKCMIVVVDGGGGRMNDKGGIMPNSEQTGPEKLPSVRPDALQTAIEKLENLSLGTVETYDSYDALEAGCLSCSGVKNQDK